MAKISVQIENGNNTLSLVQESSDIERLREAIITIMNLALTGAELFVPWIGNPDRDNRIRCIKAIRCVSGLGLKQAKDFNDQLEISCRLEPIPSCLIQREDYSKAMAELTPFFKSVELRPK